MSCSKKVDKTKDMKKVLLFLSVIMMLQTTTVLLAQENVLRLSDDTESFSIDILGDEDIIKGITDVFANWEHPDSVQIMDQPGTSNVGIAGELYDMRLHVPKGTIGRYLKAGYPWYAFGSITDGDTIVHEQSFKVGNRVYSRTSLYSDDVYLSGYCYHQGTEPDTTTVVTIPEIVESPQSGSYFRVTGIGSKAFCKSDCIEKVILPLSIETVCYNAFGGCRNLQAVCLPEQLLSIGNYAFYECARLELDSLPESISGIGEYAFAGTGLKGVMRIPSKVKIISNGMFANCRDLTGIRLHDDVVSIGYSAFYGCRTLETVSIPKSVKHISNGAFMDCPGLTDIYMFWTDSIPVVTSEYSFDQNRHILNVPYGNVDNYLESRLPDGSRQFRMGLITDSRDSSNAHGFRVGGIWYEVSDSIKNSVTITGRSGDEPVFITPASVTYPYTGVAYRITGVSVSRLDCSRLIVSNGVETVTGRFNPDVEYVFLPSTVRVMRLPFYHSSHLKSVGPAGGGYDIEYAWKDSIPAESFCQHECLEKVVISESIKSTGNRAFQDCPRLNTVYNLSATPQVIDDNTFTTDCTLYVPKGSRKLYRKSAGWKDFRKIRVIRKIK